MIVAKRIIFLEHNKSTLLYGFGGLGIEGLVLKIGAPKARNMIARGKCEAERSTSPLDKDIQKG